MKARTLSILAGLVSILVVRAADPLTDALQKGLLEEEVHRDLNAAAAAYEAVVRHADAQRAAAAAAVFRLAETYRKLGRTNDAVALYRRVLDQFSDQAPLADLSRTNLGLLVPGQPLAAPAPPATSAAEEAAELQRLQMVIRNSPDLVNARNATAEGGTPLHHAAAKGYLKVVEFLLDHGAEVNAQDNSRRCPLHHAAEAGHKRVCEVLLARGADVNAMNVTGNTPLHYAIEAESPELVEALLAAGADPNAPGWNGGREKNWPPLLAAVRPPPDSRSSPSSRTPGEGDRRQTQLAILELLLKHGADVNGRLTNGWTALHRAVQLDRADVAQLLLAHRAEVNPRGALPKSEPVLGPRRAAGAANVMDLSLKELASGQESAWATPLPLGYEPRIMYWYQYDLCTESEVTPLHVAVWYENEEMLRWLIEHGAEVNARTAAGRTPLLVAVDRLMRPEIVRLLLGASADPNAADAAKISPMHLALKLSRTNELAAPNIIPVLRTFLRGYADKIVPLLREHGGKAPPEP